MSPSEMQTTAGEHLLSLVVPPALTDPLVDWLLEQPEVIGFISLPVNGYGGSEHAMSAAEKVAGYRKGWLIQTHLEARVANALLDRLKRRFAGCELHYWITPLLSAGNLGAPWTDDAPERLD